MKHADSRDIPHPKRERGPGAMKKPRIKKADGTSFENRAVGREVRRPPLCMLFEDAADPENIPKGVYGMYPASLIGKILPWLRCDRSKLLHVCSGGLPPGEGIRVDIRPEAKPDIIADGRHLPLADSSIDAVLIDPPYSEHYARELYGTEYPRPKALLAEAVRVLRPNGIVGIVHYIVPNPPDGARFLKCFGLSMGFGYPMRAVTLYEKFQPSLFVGENPVGPRQARRRRRVGSA